MERVIFGLGAVRVGVRALRALTPLGGIAGIRGWLPPAWAA
jgi:uncharacterized membrane protein YgdD (TMEM256/DUF423 family)